MKWLAFILLALPCAADVMTYTNPAQFLAVAGTIPNTFTSLEDFNSGAVTAPDVSVRSSAGPEGGYQGYGHVENGAWSDCVGRPCDDASQLPHQDSFTNWLFDKPVYAFGATFGYGAVTPSSTGLEVAYPNGSALLPPITDGFWGFISDQPFNEVQVFLGPQLDYSYAPDQYFTMDNLLVQVDPPGMAAAPEPASFWLVMPLFLFGFLFVIRRYFSV